LAAAKDFFTAYAQKFGKPPDYIGPRSYDAINVIAAAYTGVGKIPAWTDLAPQQDVLGAAQPGIGRTTALLIASAAP
jgi:hypothetical protein